MTADVPEPKPDDKPSLVLVGDPALCANSPAELLPDALTTEVLTHLEAVSQPGLKLCKSVGTKDCGP